MIGTQCYLDVLSKTGYIYLCFETLYGGGFIAGWHQHEYLVKNMHDGLMDSACCSNWFKYEMTRIPDILDPMSSPVICL